MSRVRVVHLTTVHHPFDPRIFWKQALSLREAGFAVSLVAQHTRAETVEGVSIVPLTPTHGRYRRIVLQREAYRAARALEAAVYHFHDPELIPVAWALKRATGARIIYDVHEDYRWHGPLVGRLLRAMERWCFSWVDHVVLAEESYASLVPDATPNTVLLNYFRPFNRPTPVPRRRQGAASFRLLSAGVLAADRGLGTLLDLAGRARDQEVPWHIVLAGICYRSRDRHAAEHRIQQEGLTQRVERVGWDTYVRWDTLEASYVDADVGLALFAPNPNYTGSLPTKFYEYLFYGLPVLCSDFPRWRRFVEGQRCGAVVAPGDVGGAYGVLKQWYEQPARYDALSAAAARAAPRFLWSVMEPRLLSLYEEVLRR